MALRRRRRFSKRYPRRLRRKIRLRKRMLKRRRIARRGRRRKSMMVVRGVHENPLLYSSMLPQSETHFDSHVGVPANGFATWSINPFDISFTEVPGTSEMIGSWTRLAEQLYKRSIGVGERATSESAMLTDLPICITNISVKNAVNCSTMWKLCKLYRITRVSVTFTVPEFTNNKRNHNLYIEWTHLPYARSSAQEDCRNFVSPYDASIQSFDSKGFNWIANPPDIAQACSIEGKNNTLNGWHRKQLAYNSPVTISWRPRHAKIMADHTNYRDVTGNGTAVISAVDNWPQSDKLVRSYLPTDIDIVNSEKQWWMGPCIRLIDADTLHGAVFNDDSTSTLFDLYGIRCTTSVTVKFKQLDAHDPIFPAFTP